MKRKSLLISVLLIMSCLSSCGEVNFESINWHEGLTMPSSTINAAEGDYYFDVDDGIIYSYSNGSWTLILTIGGGNDNEGKSAYEVYVSANPNYKGSKEDFEKDLIGKTLPQVTTYTVIFNPNNGTYSFSKIITSNKKVSAPNVPVNGDKEFLGWYTSDGEKWIFDGFNVTENITLTAKWGEPSKTPNEDSSSSGNQESNNPSEEPSTPEDGGSTGITPSYETITIDQAISLTKQLTQGAKSTEYYYIKGTVTEIWNATYGNFNFGPTDNQFTVYGSYSSDGSVAYADMEAKVALNDEIIFYGQLYHYYNANSKVPTKYEVENAWIKSINGVVVNADGTLAGSSSGGNTGGNTGSDDTGNDSVVVNPGVQWTNSDFGNYYSSIDFSNNSTLLSQLQTLNKAKRTSTVGYKNMPSKFYQTDYDPKNPSKIIGFYTNESAVYSGNMNREHVWPNSRGGGSIEADIHVIRPTFTKDNSSRGNSFYVANMASSSGGWDPKAAGMLEESRGYAARIIFYSVVANGSLSLVDKDNDSTGNQTMGKLSDLLRWNLQYAVDVTELNRNNGAQDLQGNRNPFIDNPYLACAIWGNYNEETRKICAEYDVIVDPYTGDITLPDQGGNNDSSSSGNQESSSPSVEPSTPEDSESSSPSDNPSQTGGKYVKVTSNQTDWSGKYLIVYEGSSCVLNGATSEINSAGNHIKVTISNNTVAWTEAVDAAAFTIAKVTDGYTIKTSTGKYIGSTENANKIISGDTALVNNITFVDVDEVSIVSSANTYLRFNTSWNGFRYYKSTSYSSQAAVVLYKYVEN